MHASDRNLSLDVIGFCDVAIRGLFQTAFLGQPLGGNYNFKENILRNGVDCQMIVKKHIKNTTWTNKQHK